MNETQFVIAYAHQFAPDDTLQPPPRFLSMHAFFSTGVKVGLKSFPLRAASIFFFLFGWYDSISKICVVHHNSDSIPLF